MRSRLRLAYVALAVGASGWALTGPLARVLPAPPLLTPDRWRAWLGGTDPVTATATLLRLTGVALAGWLALGLAATAVIDTTADAAVGARRSVRALRTARRLVHAVIPRPVLATAVLLLGTAAAGCARPHSGGGGPGTAAPGPHTPVTVTMARTPPRPVSGPAPTAPAPLIPLAPRGWVVHGGDSMWSVAEAVVASRGGTRGQVDRYWMALERQNPRPDPDLIYPGQVLELPPYPE